MDAGLMADETVETIDLTPTWEGILPGLVGMLVNGSPESWQTANKELRKMARLADGMVALLNAETARNEATACPECGEPLTVEGAGDGTGDPQHVFCDICGKAEHPADLTPDWNGETGNHISCERPLVRK